MYLVTDKDYFWHQNDDCKFVIVRTSCKTSYNVLSHSHWVLGQFVRGGVEIPGREVVKKRESPDFRSPEVGISVMIYFPFVSSQRT